MIERVQPINRTIGMRSIQAYDPNKKREQDNLYFEEKQKEVLNNEEEKEKNKFVNVRPYNSFAPVNLRQITKIEEYDFLSKDNIQTVCYNFIVYLSMYDKTLYEYDDEFVIAKKSEFFGDYGEKLLDIQLDRIEEITGEFTGIDEIIEVKRAIYQKLNEYLDFANSHISSLIKDNRKEWFNLRENSYRIGSSDIKVISVRENFFVKQLKKLYNEEQKE